MQDDISALLRRFINENFLFQDEDSGLPEDASLRDLGIIDSTGVIELVAFLETTFGIEVREDEMYPENLDSLAALTAFVTRKADPGIFSKAA
jgi:acyl carrier protein